MNNPVLILYLEDNPRDVELVRDRLQQIAVPHELRIARDRGEYEAALAQTRFDLILSDYSLPDYDGMAALALAREKQPNVPFILISGTLGDEQAVDCMVSGATDLVLKQRLHRLVPAVLRTLTEAAEHRKRREAEEALRESEEKYRGLLENAGVGVAYWDTEGRLILFNSMAAAYMGGKPADFVGRFVIEMYDPKLADTLMERIAKTLRSDAIEVYEDYVQVPSGKMWFLSHYKTMKDIAGRPIGVQVISNDITERKQAENALKLRSAILSNMTEGVNLVGLNDGIIKYANPRFERMFGYDPGELLGKDISVVNAATRKSPEETKRDVFNRLTQTGEWQGEMENIRKDGARFWCYTNVSLFDDPTFGRVCISVHADITERKQAEDELLAAEQNYRDLFDQSRDGIVVMDRGGKVCDANRRYAEMLGYSPEEVRHLHVWDWDAQWTREQLLSGLQSADATGTFVETRHRRKDGSVLDVEFSSNVAIVGGQDRIFCICRDITERKRAEAEKAKLEDQLRQAQKMEAVGCLAGGVAHDFNNLLMGIMGYAELCRDKIAPDNPIREYLDEITHEAERSAEITRQLLAFARKQTIAPKILDLNDAVAGMLKLLRRLIGEDINLAWLPGLDGQMVKIDPSQVDQILANLCVNARDAIAGVGRINMETGSITVDAEFCAKHPEAIPGPYVFLAVTDDGCGMDKKTLAQVFEPFFTTKGLGKGTGLGLATVYGIVKQNNGFIYATSEPGKGTTFKIYLPEIAAETVATTDIGKAAAPRGRGETILLVEDEKSLRVTCGAFLDALGYKVMLAETPGDALKLTDQHPGDIHVLLTDVVMPGMDGRQLAQRISAVKPGVKVLFMSGYTADVIAQRGVLDEGVQFLSKPFTRDDLARKMRAVLEGNRIAGEQGL